MTFNPARLVIEPRQSVRLIDKAEVGPGVPTPWTMFGHLHNQRAFSRRSATVAKWRHVVTVSNAVPCSGAVQFSIAGAEST